LVNLKGARTLIVQPAFRALAIYCVARLEERPRFGEEWEENAPIRKAHPRIKKPKRKHARARNSHKLAERGLEGHGREE
jgi:hypothetical protein